MKREVTLTVLVTVDTGKHHLRGFRELLPHDVRGLLKNWMEHLTEPAPVKPGRGSGVGPKRSP